MSSAALLRRCRQEAGLSQAALARRGGTSQPAVARYESGQASPSVRTLERLLHAAGCQLHLEVSPAGAPADLSGERMRQLVRHRRAITRTARLAGVNNVRVFGSVARGDDGPDSDIDLLVDFDTGVHGALPLIRLQRELAELLGQPVDVATVDLLRPDVARTVLAEAVPL